MASGEPKSKRTPVQRAVSAGGVVLREASQGPEVVICGRDSDGVWGLPKGTPDEGETLEGAALREVAEETGLDVEIVDKIGVVEYWFAHDGTRFHKWVHYYLMRSTGGSTDAHDHEFDRVEWRAVEAALKELTFENDRAMVRKAVGLPAGRAGKREGKA
jgi:8-oxo-dGTP pyrophosphatase MutT (NUDIX family)